MAKTQKYFIEWKPKSDRSIISIMKKTLLGKSELSLDEWKTRDAGKGFARLLERGDLDSDGEFIIEQLDDGKQCSISNDWISRLDESEAGLYGLPPVTPLALRLQSYLQPSDEKFYIESKFVNRANRAVRVEVKGAFISQGDTQQRLPAPLLATYIIANKLSQPIKEPDTRFAFVADLSKALSDQFSIDVNVDNFLKKLDLSYASSLSLSLKADGASFDFDPVLYGRSIRSKIENEEVMLSETSDSLLTPNKSQRFLEQLYNRADVPPGLAISDMHYVYLPESVRAGLETIKRAKNSEPEKRKRFALNPRPYFSDALDARHIDADVEILFIETEQFSERIEGADTWTQAVTPWLKPQPNSWLPESCGIKIGETLVELPPGQAEVLKTTLEKALETGQNIVSFENQDYPVTLSTLEAVSKLCALQTLKEKKIDTQGDAVAPTKKERECLKYFLVIKENLEDITYSEQAAPLEEHIIQSISVPEQIKSSLKSYQIDGLKWVAGSQISGHRGAILADDMGLGKTLQTLSGVLWRKSNLSEFNNKPRPTLVVTPTALTDNWIEEAEKHLEQGALGEIIRVSGRDLRQYRTGRPDTETGATNLDIDLIRDAGVIITTYETLRDYHMSFAKIPFDIVVFDEIQKLKNPTTQITRAAKTLNAEFKIGLTGTPVENQLHDLWSISDVVWPGYLGSSKQFTQNYPDDQNEAINNLKQKVMPEGGVFPFLVRRMKVDRLKDLPSKSIIPHRAIMPPVQAQTYSAVINEAITAKAAGKSVSKGLMLATVQKMRSVSLHPVAPKQAINVDDEDYVASSARLAATIKILDQIEQKNEKALIFLESLDMQDWLAGYLKRRFNLDRRPFIINGGVPGSKRQEIVNKFQNQGVGFDVMILSPKAGGVGITLTEANHVIHLSRWWNPAVEDQSTDRVYRIGQTRPVSVHIPLAIHPDKNIQDKSFDLNLDSLLERKRSLSQNLLAPANAGEDPLENLFNDVTNITVDPISKKPSIDTFPKTAPVDGDLKSGPQTTDILDRARVEPDISSLGQFPATFKSPKSKPRPNADIFKFLESGNLKILLIEDAYMALPGNRDLSLSVIRDEIIKRGGIPDKLILWFFGPSHPAVRDRFESESEKQVKSLLFEGLFGNGNKGRPKKFDPNSVADRRFRDIHDRQIYFKVSYPFGEYTFRLGLGNGLEAWAKGTSDFNNIILEIEDNSIWNTL